jgi:K(+)-stimulated pyrophosphate-energized sodium pump
MHTWLATGLMGRVIRSRRLALVAVLAVLTFALPMAFAQQGQAALPTSQVAAAVNPQTGAATQETTPATPVSEAAGEANLKLPDMKSVPFMGNSISGYNLLRIGLIFCALGLLFGLTIYMQLKNAPVHRVMKEVSELIYETCKTYLVTQGKFILILEAFIAVVIVLYFGVLQHNDASRVVIILLFSLVGIAGSYGVAWFGIRVNTFANSRTAFAGLRGKPYPIYTIPLKAGMSIGMMLISVELLIMLCILLFIPALMALRRMV